MNCSKRVVRMTDRDLSNLSNRNPFFSGLRSGCSAVGRCARPKWPKTVTTTILVKMALHSDTNLLLTKNNYFRKITNFIRNFLKKSFFPGDFEGANPLKNYENNSQGIIFVIISCQGVFRTGFSICETRNGPKWSILVHFGLKRSALVGLGPPTAL